MGNKFQKTVKKSLKTNMYCKTRFNPVLVGVSFRFACSTNVLKMNILD